MRVVVTGATGNVGTSVAQALAADPAVDEVLGLSRRAPSDWAPDGVDFVEADVSRDDLVGHLRGADVVVHLAWRIQPSHRHRTMADTNVTGTTRLLDALLEARVPNLVHASSVGTYSPRLDDRPVDETWPSGGISTSTYSRHKAMVERHLDRFEAEHDGVRVVRMRPSLIFKRDAASGMRHLFLGRLVPPSLLAPGRLPLLPFPSGVRFQVVHTDDVADAYRRAVLSEERGAFNVASDPVFDAEEAAAVLETRAVPLPASPVRAALTAAWHLRLVPIEAGWLDMALQAPLLDTTRARTVLGWEPAYSGRAALAELLRGFDEGAELPTPALAA